MPAQLKPGLYGPGWLSPEDAGSGCGNGKPADLIICYASRLKGVLAACGPSQRSLLGA